MKYFSSEKGISLIKLLIIVAIIVVVIIIIGSNSKPGIEMSTDELVAYQSLRNAIEEAKASEGMTSTMLSENFDILGNMVKNADSGNEWFSRTGAMALYGNIDDEDGYEMTTLSDGKHCAIFYAKEENGKYYFTSYYFIVSDVKGYVILVGE